jgi:hypothetical protein
LFRETHSDQHSINEIPSNRVISLHKICLHSTTSRPSLISMVPPHQFLVNYLFWTTS